MDVRRSRLLTFVLGAAAALGLAARTPAAAATLPTGFTETQVASGLASPTAMAFAPDGRLFVCEQGGRLRVIKNGALLPTPFVTLTVNAVGRARPARRRLRSGLPANQYVYVYYTATTPTVHNRISRFTANGDVAAGRQRGRAPRSRQPERGHQPQRRRARLRPRRQAVRRGRRERQHRQRAGARPTCSARCSASTPTAPSRPTTRSSPRRPAATAPSGRSACATRSRSRSTRTAPEMFINDVGQNTWEEINDGLRRRQLRLAGHRGPRPATRAS